MAVVPVVPSSRALLRREGSATRVVVGPAPGRRPADGLTADLFAPVAPAAGAVAPAGLEEIVPAGLEGLALGGASPPQPAPADPPPDPPLLEDLHPALWRAHQLGRSRQGVCATGWPSLDAQLPGGGWPQGVLTELLLPHAGVGELRLLAPALAALQQQQRSLMWLDPPAAPCAWALSRLGIDVRHLVLVRSRSLLRPPQDALRQRLPAADILWALEQALKSAHLGAVLAWLPARLPAEALRRLQLAAQSHEGPVFLLRDARERLRPSAAPLRLLLSSAGPDALQVQVFKRRGAPLAQPLALALPPVLAPLVQARAQRALGPASMVPAAAGQHLPAPAGSAPAPLAAAG